MSIKRNYQLGRALAIACTVVVAQSLSAAEYDVEHALQLRPGGNVVPRVKATYFAHSFIKERDGDCKDFAVEPALQGQGFEPYRWDRLSRRFSKPQIRVRNGRSYANTGSINVPAGGINRQISAFTPGCQSWADANSEITVNPLTAGGVVTGKIGSWGMAEAAIRPPRKSSAYAFSMAMVEAQGGRELRDGSIRWRWVVRDIVVGRASSRRQVDPIDYTVTDRATGDVSTGTFFNATVEVLGAGAGGGFSWENDVVEIESPNVDLKVEFPSPFTSLQGVLELQVREGKVSFSNATGHYAGALPPVGTEVPFSFPLANEEEFDYDLGSVGGDDVDVNLEFSGGGEALEEKSAEPEIIYYPIGDSFGGGIIDFTPLDDLQVIPTDGLLIDRLPPTTVNQTITIDGKF